jgi:hypothetical protein
VFLLAALSAVTATVTSGAQLSATLALEADLLDYGLPKHPRAKGSGHLGAIVRPSLFFRPSSAIEIEAGATIRLPFAIDFDEELGARPVLALRLDPFPNVRLTFGSLEVEHGLHPGVFDEDRARYARDLERAYNSSLRPEAARALGGDPFMPAQQGASLLTLFGPFRGEAFLDWQLLETIEHREKFAFGALAKIDLGLVAVSGDLYVAHYGGELFTARDPLRATGLDPKRQPISLALTGALRLLEIDSFDIELFGSVLAGHAIQSPGERARWHSGSELGLELRAFEGALFAYRLWLPRGGDPGVISEEGDPIYRGGSAHRATIGLVQEIGDVSIEGRLDLVFPVGSNAVQYLAVTLVRYRLELLLWQAD